jgi:hypothetical protein
MSFPRGGTEYGGHAGLVQPEPHDIKKEPAEYWMLIKQTDPADEADTPEKAADRIRSQGRIDTEKQNG